MRVVFARWVTYGIIGAMALLAVKLTPPLPQRSDAAVSPAFGTDSLAPTRTAAHVRPTLPAIPVAPVIVTAQRLQGPDTVALSGTIHSSLMAALDKVGEGELPKGQRRSLAWLLADIFESPNSGSKWFDGNGKSLKASFLRAPLNFRRITSVFGWREHPLFGEWRNHTGTDYAAPAGTPVRAIGDGVVVSAGWMGGYGNMIDIRHNNGYISRYGHLSRFAMGLHRGDHVTMGTTIGYVGMTGMATGSHLHFEIRVGGVAHDPKSVLRGKTGDPLPASEARLFQEIRAHTMSALEGIDRASERVASRG